MYTLYWSKGSANMVCHAALIEIGAPYKLIEIDADKGEQKSAAYLKINPHARVPTLIVSPYAKRGEIGHGQYEHASILKLIEWRFGLDPLTDRDRRAATFLEALDFSQSPRPPVSLP